MYFSKVVRDFVSQRRYYSSNSTWYVNINWAGTTLSLTRKNEANHNWQSDMELRTPSLFCFAQPPFPPLSSPPLLLSTRLLGGVTYHSWSFALFSEPPPPPFPHDFLVGLRTSADRLLCLINHPPPPPPSSLHERSRLCSHLVLRGDFEVVEKHDEDEQVVHREWLLHDVAREKFEHGLFPLDDHRPEPESTRCQKKIYIHTRYTYTYFTKMMIMGMILTGEGQIGCWYW